MITTTTFKVGQKVTWKSQAGGYMKTKTGKIVGIIKAGTAPAKKFGNFAGAGRKAPSFIIEANGRYYWPHTTLLSKKG